MSTYGDTGWDGGFEDAVDTGELGELMLGPYQRYDSHGAAPAARWGSRTSIHTRRHAVDLDNLPASECVGGVADGRNHACRLRPLPIDAGEVHLDETLLSLLRDHVVAHLADVFDVPVPFMWSVVFDDHALRSAAALDPDDVCAMRALYRQTLETEAAALRIELPARSASTPARHPAPVCTACHCAIHDGRCRCS